ncbi:hypothetical protein EDB81DRAFT_672191 [Dactylonectria macrodidyma]|uniref:Xylanolytic transcriptional activator regulatory domain-containing protein n=1 Tax=Dactylonectria macrodidyma TaxID=307937 RepID=A0A9P9I8E8_9HYPO|nr:hypothetical protein EDB81DRAFT_672191 [Dactylonectria macrodidyma]
MSQLGDAETPAGVINATETSWPRTAKLSDLCCETLLRMVTIYEEEVGLSYPVVALDPLRKYIAVTYKEARLGSRAETLKASTPAVKEDRYDEQLVVIISIVMVLQSGGRSDIGARWVDKMASVVRHRTTRDRIGVQDIVLLVLMAFLYFHSDREILAWRMTGEAARMLLELGFHRSETLKKRYPTRNELRQAVKLFWSVYNTERRFSYGSGLPFVLQDADIDHDLPEPDESSFSSMYVKSMIVYTRIASHVWRSATTSPELSTAFVEGTRDRLDFRVLQWRKSLPIKLQFRGVEETFDPEKHVWGHWRLRLMLYLRANQMRIVIHRNVIHHKAMPRGQKRLINPSSINTLIEIAQDTIRVLAQLTETADLYKIQQQTYNFFLESALASLLVVIVTNEPIYGDICTGDVRLAMNVIHKFAAHSSISNHLRTKIDNFRNVERRVRGSRSDKMWQSSRGVADGTPPVVCPPVSDATRDSQCSPSLLPSEINLNVAANWPAPKMPSNMSSTWDSQPRFPPVDGMSIGGILGDFNMEPFHCGSSPDKADPALSLYIANSWMKIGFCRS